MVLWTETNIEALISSCCPQVTKGHGGYREFSETKDQFVLESQRQGAEVFPMGPGELQPPRNPLPGQAPQAPGTEDSLYVIISAASWLGFKSQFCHFFTV